MNNKALTMSLLMGALAAFFVNSYVNSIEDEAKKKFGTEVVVLKAKRNIKEMETITDADMIERDVIPKRFVQPGAVFFEGRSDDGEKNEKAIAAIVNSVNGSVAVVPIQKGEQIIRSKLTEPNIRTGLAPQVTPGRRAVGVPVTEISGISKLVKPGDRVDLIAVLDMGGGKENKIAKTILQDVVVLSVGRSVTNNAARLMEADSYGGKDKVKSLAEDFSFSSVTLEVDPAQAQALALVMGNGDNALTLSLRNNDDTDKLQTSATVFTDVLGQDAGRARGPAAKR